MKLQFLSSWRGYREGRIYDVPTGAALIYLRRGIAVESVETSTTNAGDSPVGKSDSNTSNSQKSSNTQSPHKLSSKKKRR